MPDRTGQTPGSVPAPRAPGQRKGGDDLVNAFAGLPDALRAARLVIAGDGDVEGMKKLAAPLSVQR